MIQFSDQQQKTIDSRGKNVVVSASAGSGKTSVLVERLSRLVIEDRISIDTIYRGRGGRNESPAQIPPVGPGAKPLCA